LKTYSDGNVTISVSRNNAGTFSMLAAICIGCPLPLPVMLNRPMQAP
jgi:hypothetical protein